MVKWVIRFPSAGASHVASPAKTDGYRRKFANLFYLHQPASRKNRGVFGSPETTTGGKALKFYASVRLDIRRIGAIKEGDKTSATAPASR